MPNTELQESEEWEEEGEFDFDDLDTDDSALLDEVTEGDEDDEDYPRASRSQRGRVDVASIIAERDAFATKVEELTHRIGEVVRISGQRNREYREEVEEWAANVQTWHAEKEAEARREAFEEGARSVEKRLLPLLDSEEKGDYLEEVRLSPVNISPREPVKLEFKPKSQENQGVSAVVDQFTSLGVPFDQLDRTSVESVVASGTKYLTSKVAAVEEKVQEVERKVESRIREATGATRVSSGGGGTTRSPAGASSLQQQLDSVNEKIDKARRAHNMNAYPELKRQKDTIENEIRRRNAARR